jgi:muconolactone delta-isomerase
MEYIVTMTTHVPAGTAEADIQDIRTREEVRSRELATQGHLLRLWRPPLQPGEWRSLGLFAAADDAQLEQILSSMPLRVWRTDEPTPLAPHANDPAGEQALAAQRAQLPGATEFLTTFVVTAPAGTPAEEVSVTEAREAERARELTADGHLERLWRLAGEGQSLGLWRAADGDDMQAIVESLPLFDWMTVQTTALTPHPSDPPLAFA